MFIYVLQAWSDYLQALDTENCLNDHIPTPRQLPEYVVDVSSQYHLGRWLRPPYFSHFHLTQATACSVLRLTAQIGFRWSSMEDSTPCQGLDDLLYTVIDEL